MKNTDLTYEIQPLTRVERNRPKCGKVPEIGAKAVISPMEHNELFGGVRVDTSDDNDECTYEYATVPTKPYANNAPRGPAPCSADPDPRNRPVPTVPAICP
jgi:hypothetical protein